MPSSLRFIPISMDLDLLLLPSSAADRKPQQKKVY
jgi:hypothetical protein